MTVTWWDLPAGLVTLQQDSVRARRVSWVFAATDVPLDTNRVGPESLPVSVSTIHSISPYLIIYPTFLTTLGPLPQITVVQSPYAQESRYDREVSVNRTSRGNESDQKEAKKCGKCRIDSKRPSRKKFCTLDYG